MFVRHCVDVVGDIAELAELSVTGVLKRTELVEDIGLAG
jgi:hypothetical protein